MTDPTDTIERVLEQHRLAFAAPSCECGYSLRDGSGTQSTHVAHVAAEIVKALNANPPDRDGVLASIRAAGLDPAYVRTGSWRVGDHLRIEVIDQPARVNGNYVASTPRLIPWVAPQASQEPRERPRATPGHAETQTRETDA